LRQRRRRKGRSRWRRRPKSIHSTLIALLWGKLRLALVAVLLAPRVDLGLLWVPVRDAAPPKGAKVMVSTATATAATHQRSRRVGRWKGRQWRAASHAERTTEIGGFVWLRRSGRQRRRHLHLWGTHHVLRSPGCAASRRLTIPASHQILLSSGSASHRLAIHQGLSANMQEHIRPAGCASRWLHHGPHLCPFRECRSRFAQIL